MTRCKYCDWSPNSEQSLYNKGLTYYYQRRGNNIDKRLVYKTDGPVCTECLYGDKTLLEAYPEETENE